MQDVRLYFRKYRAQKRPVSPSIMWLFNSSRLSTRLGHSVLVSLSQVYSDDQDSTDTEKESSKGTITADSTALVMAHNMRVAELHSHTSNPLPNSFLVNNPSTYIKAHTVTTGMCPQLWGGVEQKSEANGNTQAQMQAIAPIMEFQQCGEQHYLTVSTIYLARHVHNSYTYHFACL